MDNESFDDAVKLKIISEVVTAKTELYFIRFMKILVRDVV